MNYYCKEGEDGVMVLLQNTPLCFRFRKWEQTEQKEQEQENEPSGPQSEETTTLQRQSSGCSQMRLCSSEVWEKSFFHFISVRPSIIARLIKRELALDFLQMFLSKQINLCGINIEKVFFPGCFFYELMSL